MTLAAVYPLVWSTLQLATGWARDLLGLAAVFVFIGLDPNTEFLLGVVDLDQWGAIKTSTTLETNLRGIPKGKFTTSLTLLLNT